MDVACAQGVGVTITTGVWLERCVLIDLLVAMDRVLGQMRVFLANLASSRFRKAPQWRIPCGASRERARHAIQDPDTVPFCSCQTPFNKQSSFSGAIKRNHQPPRPRLHVADFSMRSRSISPVVTEAKLVPEQMFREGFIKEEGVLERLGRIHSMVAGIFRGFKYL